MEKNTAEKLYEAFYMKVFSYVMTLTGDRNDAMDITQETFLRAISTSKGFRGESECYTWLCAIAKNVLMNHRRKQKRTSEEGVPEPTDASAEEYVLQRMGQEAVFAAIHRVSEPGREILYLRLLGGMSFREIGSILGKSENWARVCFYRAKQTLIKELKEHENDTSL